MSLSKSLNTASMNVDSLEENMRHFVIKYEQGCRKASDLVSKEALQVREVIARESERTDGALRDQSTQISTKIQQVFDRHAENLSRAQFKEKLLNSVKYTGMNERANQIENAHTDTFGWLFAELDESSNSDDVWGNNDDAPSYSDDEACNHGHKKFAGAVWSSFTDWLQSDLSIYWIMGKPGSGKSTLTKYILSEPRTKITLERWRSSVIMLNHHFWRPGNLLQRSIKGMLCSIVYQLVLTIPEASEYTLANVVDVSQKDNDTDWSVFELQQLCLGLIMHCGKPLCLIIDGLDECGPEDDHQRLLETLERIRLQNVKIIASSRNEPTFERRFRHEPQLRMQDLMADDLRTYAKDMLRKDIGNNVKFFTELVEEAEGVFLWLVLVVQSINRGLDNGERLTDLRERMKSLPKRLNDLYMDMWDRLNDDGELYRRSAALYFRLAMAARGTQLGCAKHGLSIMEMMLASFEKTHYAFSNSPVISTSQLLEECEGFRKRVEIRCAGLLGIYGKSTGSIHAGNAILETESALLEYTDKKMGFQFIHRSAHDFLVDTIEGQDILKHEGMSSEDLSLRVLTACLRASELVFLLLRKATRDREAHCIYPSHEVVIYLCDLSSIANARGSDVEALFSLCYELYSSSVLLLNHWDTHVTRTAAFFGVASFFPNLHRYSTPIIENRVVGKATRSAILLSVVSIGQRTFPLKLARWLLRLREIDVNLKCPLFAFWAPTPSAVYTLEDIGPQDHIKASPFTRLLGFGLEHLEWGPIVSTRQRHQTAQFLQMISEFALQGADFRSTLFLAISLDALKDLREESTEHRVLPGLFHMSAWDFFKWTSECDDESILCVVAFEATTVIETMLDNVPETALSHDSTDEDEYNSGQDESSFSEIETATTFLSQRCHEDACGANDRVIGLLQPCGNFVDMPYRQMSARDSADLMGMIWTCTAHHGPCWADTKFKIRELVARSPFSSIGFRDYLRDMGCFDEYAAHKLVSEYQEGL